MQERTTDARQPKKTPLATMGLAVVALASVFGPSVAAAQEIFADDFESGDISKWSADVGYEPDSEAPALELVSPGLSELAEGSLPAIMLAYSDPGSGVDTESLRVEVDASDVTSTCTIGSEQASCPMPALALGGHSLAVALSDRAGNEAELSFAFTVVADSLVPRPRITIVRPGLSIVGDATPEIEVAWSNGLSDTLSVELDGSDLSASCTVSSGSALCEPMPLASGEHELRAEIRNSAGVAGSALVLFELQLGIQITIESPENGHLTRDDTVTLRGSVGPEATEVLVAGVSATLDGSGGWEVNGLPLREGANPFSATARRVIGGVGTGGVGTAVVTVVKDTEAPRIVLRTPGAGTVVTQSTVLVTGEVADPVSSSFVAQAPRVTVNGIEAEVEHKSFLVENFLLQRGENRIVATAQDSAGNVGRTELVVQHDPDALRKIEEAQGNAQRGVVGETLGQPLVVRLVDRIGNPLPNRPVTFRVTRGDGAVVAYPKADEQLVVLSDERGLAQVRFALGRRSGVGNQEVAAEAEGFTGTVVFCASAAAALPERIKPIPGNDHSGATTGEVGQPLPRPLYAQAFDENGNPVPDLLISWEVVEGGGTLKNGTPIATSRTDAEGKATMTWVLGPDTEVNGQQVIASFAGLDESPAIFVATAKNAGSEAQTAIVGFVTDNQDEPMNKVRVEVENTALWAETGPDGRFRIDGAPVGEVHLLVNGTTTDREGIWARLAFEMTTVPGIDNDLGMPIRLLPLSESSDSRKIVGGDKDVTLSLEGVPGAELTVRANSVTFPDGSPTGELSVTQVHSDKVPMVPPLGSSFMLAWTIQPPGVKFDPPARIAIPNFGDPPGTVVDIYSFDHDLGEFLSIGTATVSEDGTQLASDPGFGVVKSGWHGCLPPPPPTADTCRAGTCQMCEEGSKKTVPKCGPCKICEGGDCVDRSVYNLEARARVGQGDWESGEITVGLGQEVIFEAESEGTCGNRTEYEWTFPGDEVQAGRAANYTFDEEGLFAVRSEVSCFGCPLAGSALDTIRVRVVTLDLAIQELEEEDQAEPNEESPGGVVFVNHDDDNDNGLEDREEPGEVTGEDDLVPLAVRHDRRLTGVARLEGGGPELRVWREATRRTRVDLPREWQLDRETVPETLYLEGLGRSLERGDLELRFTVREEGATGAAIEDKVVLTVVDLDFQVLPDEVEGIDDHPASRAVVAAAYYVGETEDDLVPIADSTPVKWRVTEGGAGLSESESTFETGLAATVLSSSEVYGTTYRVEGTLEEFRFEGDPVTHAIRLDPPLVRETEALTVVQGVPVALQLSAVTAYDADGTAVQEVTATATDANGNPVEDGTPVSWAMGVSESGFAEGNDLDRSETVGGVARAVIRAPNLPIDQVIEAAAGSARASTTVPVNRLQPVLDSVTDELDVATEETAEVTLSVNAANGTRVFWTTSNGSIVGESLVLAGTTSVTLSSVGGTPGPVVVTATIGARKVVWEGSFTSSATVYQEIENRFLVSNLVGNGFRPFMWPDGTERSVPYFGIAEVVLRGPPSALVQVSAGGDQSLEAFLFEEEEGGEVLGALAGTSMSVPAASLDSTTGVSGTSSLRLESGQTGTILSPPSTGVGLGLSFWLSTESSDGGLLAQSDWKLEVVSSRVRARVDLGAGPVQIEHPASVGDGAWHSVHFEVLAGLVRLSVDDVPVTLSTGGSSAISFSAESLVAGSALAWNVDDLRLFVPGAGGPLFFTNGLDAAGLLRLDETGKATYEIRSGGLGSGQDVEQTPLTVTLISTDQRVSSRALPSLIERAREEGGESVSWVVWANDVIWISVTDGVSSFFGGDPDTKIGTITNIAGGIVVVGDLGAMVKNAWRSLGFSQNEVNTPEVILSGIGLITEVAVGTGEIVDVPISAARALVAKLGNTPFTQILTRRMWRRIVDDVPATQAEGAFVDLLKEEEPLSTGFNRIIRSEDTFDAALEVCRKFSLELRVTNLKHARVMRAIASLSEEAGLGAVKALEGLSDDAAKTLARLPDNEFSEAMQSLNKIMAATVDNVRAVDPELVAKVLNNSANILTPNYGLHKLLIDLGDVADVPGVDKLFRSLKVRNPSAIGFRYELEAAVHLKTVQGFDLRILGERVRIPGNFTPPRYTDLDIFGIDPASGKEIAFQVKNGYNALRGLPRAKKWVGAMKRTRGLPTSQIKYMIPPGTTVPGSIRRFLNRQRPPIEILDTVPHVRD